MNLEFNKLVIGGFFGFLTLMLSLGLVPSVAPLIYRNDETLHMRLLVPISFALITALTFVLPEGVIEGLLASAGAIIMSFLLVRRAKRKRHDVV